MVMRDAPPELKVVGQFKAGGSWALPEVLFDKYIAALTGMSVAPHSLFGFRGNGGLGGGGYSAAGVPRVTVRDDQGALELMVEAYTRSAGPPCIQVYSTEPERARKVLGAQFTPDEFSQ